MVLVREASSRRAPRQDIDPVSLTTPSGIGQGRITDNLKGAPIDDAVFIPDEQSIEMAFRMLHEEGICLGASSALNAAAAFEVGRRGRGRKRSWSKFREVTHSTRVACWSGVPWGFPI